MENSINGKLYYVQGLEDWILHRVYFTQNWSINSMQLYYINNLNRFFFGRRWQSVGQFSCSVMSNSLWPHALQHTRLPCPSPNPRAYSISCPSIWWCHPSYVIPFSFHLQSFPAAGSFPVSQFFTSDSQSIGTSPSASVLPMNTQDWSPLELTGLMSL